MLFHDATMTKSKPFKAGIMAQILKIFHLENKVIHEYGGRITRSSECCLSTKILSFQKMMMNCYSKYTFS